MSASPLARSLSSAGGFGATAGAASPRTGIKRDIDDLFQKVQEHEDALSRVDATLEKNAAISDDSLKAVQASLKASIASLRDEMTRKLQAITIEIAQLQKQMNVQRGESNILAQGVKDNTKRLDLLSTAVSDLSAEIQGEEAATTPAALGATGAM